VWGQVFFHQVPPDAMRDRLLTHANLPS